MQFIKKLLPVGKVIPMVYRDKKTGQVVHSKINRRPGTPMTVKYITVHNTGNPDSTAENERDWLENEANSRQASWHDVIRENLVITAIPHTEQAYHATDGRGPGNTASIGIEICESGDFEVSKRTAAQYIASLLIKYNLGLDRVKQHHDWYAKDCPRLLRPIWPEFIAMIKEEMIKMTTPGKPTTSPIPQWKLDGIQYLRDAGYVSDYDTWVKQLDEPLPAWAVFSLMAKIAKGGSK